jgi:hypothetical protein
LYASCILTNSFPFRLPLVHTFGISSPGGSKGNNKITELRAILQRESQNS